MSLDQKRISKILGSEVVDTASLVKENLELKAENTRLRKALRHARVAMLSVFDLYLPKECEGCALMEELLQ